MKILSEAMLVVCMTDERHRCMAALEIENVKQARAVRKHICSLMPPQLRSSVQIWAGSKQRFIKHRLSIAEKVGYPLPPVKWFALDDTLPECFEDLQVRPEVLQSYLLERQAALRKKLLPYWFLPVFWKTGI